jgi:hypothetical protein
MNVSVADIVVYSIPVHAAMLYILKKSHGVRSVRRWDETVSDI